MGWRSPRWLHALGNQPEPTAGGLPVRAPTGRLDAASTPSDRTSLLVAGGAVPRSAAALRPEPGMAPDEVAGLAPHASRAPYVWTAKGLNRPTVAVVGARDERAAATSA